MERPLQGAQPQVDRCQAEEEAGKEGRWGELKGGARVPNTNKEWILLLFCLRLCCLGGGTKWA